MDGLDIRPITPPDIPAVTPLLRGYLAGDGEAPDGARAATLLLAMLESPLAHVCVAVHGGDPLGFIGWAWTFSPSRGQPVLRVLAIHTTPTARRQGVGRALLAHAEATARAAGAQRLELETDEGNVAARGLYRDRGFEEFPRKRVYMRFVDPVRGDARSRPVASAPSSGAQGKGSSS